MLPDSTWPVPTAARARLPLLRLAKHFRPGASTSGDI